MLSLCFLPLIYVTVFPISHYALFISMYVVCGFGMAGVGMGVMHDAIHGSYAKNPKINRLVGYTINLIGGNDEVWKLQHNVLHHSYTNVEAHDDDINAPFFLRFSPHVKLYKIHRFQHYYAWVFYALSTISWVTLKDYERYIRYNKMGLVKSQKTFTIGLIRMTLWKAVYFFLTIGAPIMFSSFEVWQVLLGFLIMHCVTGTILTMIFQTAHVSPENEFPLPDKSGQLEHSLAIHQLETTCNFSPKSKMVAWLVGGLNHQIEHHLFPQVSHVHYSKIAPIVERTAKEFGLPYRTYQTFWEAIRQHVNMLKGLGRSKQLGLSDA